MKTAIYRTYKESNMSQNDARTVSATERRRRAVTLRKQGLSYQAIANELGMAKSSVHSAVAKAMQAFEKEIADEAILLATLELDRLDSLQAALWEKAMAGKLGAVGKVLKIMERRAKLLGLDGPTKVAPTSAGSHLSHPEPMTMSPEEQTARIAELQEKWKA
jgi:hypothetical protein